MTPRQSYEMKDGSVLETAKHVDLAPENVDYSGATAKTDPKEIALVRKLDWWIVPILCLMYVNEGYNPASRSRYGLCTWLPAEKRCGFWY